MKKVFFLFLFFGSFDAITKITTPKKTVIKKSKSNTIIRVLIQEINLKDKPKIILNFTNGFVISDIENKKSYGFKENLLDIFYSQNSFNLNGRKLKSKQIRILPKKDHIEFNSNTYHGSFVITIKQNKLYLVNYVNLENYVLAVLPSESWPGWPKEVNKALCICFRSYALAKVLEQRKLNKKRKTKGLFDIKNTNIHQTYNGFKNISQLKEAVQETEGIILAYNKQPILAMFDSCCGGVIPAQIKDINFSNSPYLARPYPCVYCKDCFINTWEKEYSIKELEEILGTSYKNIKIKSIKVTNIDQAGKVHEIRVKGQNSWIKITGKKLYSLLKDIKSFCYSIEKKANKIIFKGRGYGHHLGLCQWGAYNMIKSKWSYKDTLKFFYPNTVFMKLKVKSN